MRELQLDPNTTSLLLWSLCVNLGLISLEEVRHMCGSTGGIHVMSSVC